ncbi:MAG: inositol monophosphatase family protein [Verrucomicrobia bacterium]|nr:inositol monophosphatase family protein [Verrucomicrobiota bacterium]
MNLTEMLTKVIPVVREAGDLAKAAFGASKVVRKRLSGDLVTDVDLSVNGLLTDALQRLFPQIGIISEESEKNSVERDLTWLVDPIDGSKHFAKGIPLYAISVALQNRNELLLGVVYAPSTGEMFTALTTQGTFRNGQKAVCSQEASLERAIVCVELPSRHSGPRAIRQALQNLQAVMLHCQRARIIGVSSLGLCYAACGGFDGYVNLGSLPNACWDTAAGEIIAREAGCLVSRQKGVTIVGNRSLHKQLADILS